MGTYGKDFWEEDGKNGKKWEEHEKNMGRVWEDLETNGKDPAPSSWMQGNSRAAQEDAVNPIAELFQHRGMPS